MPKEQLLSNLYGRREWLLTDGVGGYALGSCDGRMRRRYHSALTIAALPPIRRINVVGFVEERLVVDGVEYSLFESPDGKAVCDQVRGTSTQDDAIVWRQEITTKEHQLTISKRLVLKPGGGTEIQYETGSPMPTGTRLIVRPVLFQRCHHRTLGLDAFPHVVELPETKGNNLFALKTSLVNIERLVFRIVGGDCTVRNIPRKYILNYSIEVERGFEHEEPVESDFDFDIAVPKKKDSSIVFFADVIQMEEPQAIDAPSIKKANQKPLISKGRRKDDKELWGWLEEMTHYSDHFIVTGKHRNSIIAGYPWFGAWGRDTFIALGGLCLVQGRFDIAKSVLAFFADHLEKGLIPNRFYMAPERVSAARDYGHVDGTMWFLLAAARYAERTHDKEFIHDYVDKVEDIVAWHEKGTHFNIHIDGHDGLLYAGCHGVPLTWMHAHIGECCFTHRAGKPIEVQALWIAAMRKWSKLATLVHRASLAEKLERLADTANRSLDRYWNEEYGWFADVLDTPSAHGYHPDLSLRPNQLIALALPEVEIEQRRRERALHVIRETLLTPIGIRGLSPKDSKYRPIYSGSPDARDATYHNGPSWPWLLGSYLEAQKLAFGNDARLHCAEVLNSVRGFYGKDCVGHLAEMYDGDYPYTARGCPAHAISLAETIRAVVEVYLNLDSLPYANG
jgi:predicted glycogen debranching enzyme